MITTIFCDFDGTISDCRERLYSLFCELINNNTLTREQYWNLKCMGVLQRDIVKNYGLDPKEFQKKWLACVEDPKRVKLDCKIPDADEFLTKVHKKNCKLIILTNRQHPEILNSQLEYYGWKNFFSKILVTKQQKTKFELVQQCSLISSDCLWLGDTEEDVIGAKKLGLKSAAVHSYMVSWEKVLDCHPDYKGENLLEIFSHILSELPAGV